MVAAAASLVVAIAGLVTALSRFGGDEEPGATAATRAATFQEDATDAELRSHIPAALRQTCTRSTDAEPAAVAAFNCKYRRIVGLQYNLFASPAELRTAYQDVKGRYGLDRASAEGSCAQGYFEGDYRGRGSMLCFVDSTVASIVWTDDDLEILTFAWRNDGLLPELFDAWKAGVGPEP
jgi:hypothetical protein